MNIEGYTLIDSGEGRKLERYGTKVIDRPSSLCAWRRRQPVSTWEDADASYKIDGGWEFPRSSFTSWQADVAGVKLNLELMSNGQLGIFPEHSLYLPELGQHIARIRKIRPGPVQVLNLFAYTGLATCFCSKQPDVMVTHVDLAKRAIESAKANLALNIRGSNDSVRWIVDDALAFMAREGRKGSKYDIIIIDPPSFSRVSKANSWTLDEKLPDITHLMLDILNLETGAVFFTNHSSASTVDIARNIALDYFDDEKVTFSSRSLALHEQTTTRQLPAGSLIALCRRSE